MHGMITIRVLSEYVYLTVYSVCASVCASLSLSPPPFVLSEYVYSAVARQ